MIQKIPENTFVCTLCDSKDVNEIFIAYGYPIMQCNNCSLAFSGGVKAKTLPDYYNNGYYEVAVNYADSLKNAINQINSDHLNIVKFIEKETGRPGTVMDIGCGSGALLNAFSSLGWNCVGLEPSREMAHLVRSILGFEVYEQTFESLNLPLGPFDAITATHVLEHSPDPIGFIKKCHFLLKERGIIVIEVPDFGSRMARKLRDKWQPLYPDTHLFHYNIKSLSRLLNQNGFAILKFVKTGGLGILSNTPNPAASTKNGESHIKISERIKQKVFTTRKLFYKSERLKRFVRYCYWHLMGMNDFIRIYAAKK